MSWSWLSSDIAQIAKAKQYVAEPARFSWQGPNRVILHGKHHTHTLRRDADGNWHCTCAYAAKSHWPCSHVRALETLLEQKDHFPEADLQALRAGA